jgi:hypothetical protein
MNPGILSSPIVFGLVNGQGLIPDPVAIESVFSAEINATSTGTRTINIGPEFVGRFFVVSWFTTRGVVTGLPSGEVFQVNGVAHPFTNVGETAYGFQYHALVVAAGTSMTLLFSSSSADVRRFNVWKIGTSENPGQIVEAATVTSAAITTSLVAPLRSSFITPDTKVIAVAGARPQLSGTTYEGSWLVPSTVDQETHRAESTRVQVAEGTVPEGVTSFTLPDTTPTARSKAASYYQIRQAPPTEGPFNLNELNLKYRFNADFGCFRDLEEIIPCYDGDGVAIWKNTGTSVDAKQTIKARRPTLKTGGVNGHNYIECLRDNQQHFEDLLDLPQASGLTGWTPLTLTMVVQFYNYDQMNPIISDGGDLSYKSDFHIRTTGIARLHKGTDNCRSVPANQLVVLSARIRNNTNADYMLNGVATTCSMGGNSPSAGQTVTQFLRSTGVLGPGYFHGRLYELMIYHDTPAVGTLGYESTQRYLMQKYGIPLTY